MKKKMLVLLLAMLLGAGFTVSADEDEELTAPDDGLEINFIQGNSERDLSVEFNHSSHEGYECSDCHHKMYQQKGNKEPESCASCHDKFDVNDTKGYKSYFKAMHKVRRPSIAQRPSCVSCHTNEFGDDKSMTGCATSACHPDGLN